jgi:signal-transduction protein with cAMP-binding, CBS, and nucleotidyltransferase domain
MADYLDSKVGDVAEKDLLVLDESTTVAEAVKAMREKGVSSVFVSRKDKKNLVGIVTERDVLYRVVADNKGPFKVTLKEVMSSPLVTIADGATVRDAITVMRKKGIRRIAVTRAGEVAGMITLKSVIGNMPGEAIELATVDVPASDGKVACPYCGSRFDSKDDMSKHIDRLHLGSGLLEGDMRQW